MEKPTFFYGRGKMRDFRGVPSPLASFFYSPKSLKWDGTSVETQNHVNSFTATRHKRNHIERTLIDNSVTENNNEMKHHLPPSRTIHIKGYPCNKKRMQA